MHPFKDTPSSLKSLLSKDQTKLHSFIQLCNNIFLLMSRNYVSLFNKKYVCMVVIGFPFLLQSSEPYWPFGLVFDNAVSVVSGGNLGVLVIDLEKTVSQKNKLWKFILY